MGQYTSAKVMAKDRAARDEAYLDRVSASPTRWTTSDGDLVVDLRRLVRRTHRLPDVPQRYNHVVGPRGRRVRIGFAKDDASPALIMSLVVKQVTVHVLVDDKHGFDLLFPWLMPGLRGAMGDGMWTWNADSKHFTPYRNLDVRTQQSWEHLPVVHAALLDPASWWAGTRRRAGIGGLRYLAGWASIGATTAREACDWGQTGLRPDDVVNWRAAGWSDEDLREWATDPTGWDPDLAALFARHGLRRDVARSWRLNALAMNPRTAARLHANGWSPTGARNVRHALRTSDTWYSWAGLNDPDPDEMSGDDALEAWSQVCGISAAEAVECIRAGIRVDEAEQLVTDGSFNRDAVQVLAALTA